MFVGLHPNLFSMKAYEVKYGGKVTVVDEDVITPPASTEVKQGETLKLLSLDGAFRTAINNNGDKVYISALTEVKPVDENGEDN